jgi:FkbM family methyltransferase
VLLDLQQLATTYNCHFNGVLHLGAQFGQEIGIYRKLGIQPIVLIEPLPKSFTVLTEAAGPDCICINTAVGNFNGRIEMYVDEGNAGGSSSVLRPLLHLTQYPHISFPQNILVPIARVDDLNIPQCNFMNLDIQGYELEALKGAAMYLSAVDYVLTEVNSAELYAGCARVEEIDDYLATHGLTRVETNWEGGTWGDAFYMKVAKA